MKLADFFYKNAVPPVTVPQSALLAVFTAEELARPYLHDRIAVALSPAHSNENKNAPPEPLNMVEIRYGDNDKSGMRLRYNLCDTPNCFAQTKILRELVCERLIDARSDTLELSVYARWSGGANGPYHTYRAHDFTALLTPDQDNRLSLIFASNMAAGINPRKAEYIDPFDSTAKRLRTEQIFRAVLDNAIYIKGLARQIEKHPQCRRNVSVFPAHALSVSAPLL